MFEPVVPPKDFVICRHETWRAAKSDFGRSRGLGFQQSLIGVALRMFQCLSGVKARSLDKRREDAGVRDPFSTGEFRGKDGA